MAKKSTINNPSLGSLEQWLNLYFGEKAPALPNGLKEGIVKFGPWLILVMLLVSLPMLLAAFGLGSIIMPFSFLRGVSGGLNYTVGFVFTFAVLALEALALPGLFKRQKRAWNLLFYATLVSLVQNLVLFNLAALVISSVISWYILFQIRAYYH